MASEDQNVPDLFASGFGACWAKMVVEHPNLDPPFLLTDAEIERAWMIHIETAECEQQQRTDEDRRTWESEQMEQHYRDHPHG